MSCHLQQFERLFAFNQKIEDLLYTVPPEEVSVCSLAYMTSVLDGLSNCNHTDGLSIV